MTSRFTMNGARSYSAQMMSIVSLAVAIESVVLHQVLKGRYPTLDLLLLVSSAVVFIWILRDYIAMGQSSVEITPDDVRGQIGRRLNFSVPRAAVSRIEPPGLMPASGPPKGYLNITKPAPPNAVIVFAVPVTMRVLGMSRPVSQLAVRVDDPVAFLQAGARP